MLQVKSSKDDVNEWGENGEMAYRQKISQITFEKLKWMGEERKGWEMNDGVIVREGASSGGGHQV